MISDLNRRIKIKSATTVKDDAGGVSNGPIVVDFETWAKVEPVSSKALLLQGVSTLQNVYSVKIRYSPSHVVNSTKLVEYEGKDLVISSVQEEKENNKRFLKLLISEQSLNG